MPTRAGIPCKDKACTGIVRNGVCSVCGSQRKHKDRTFDAHRGNAHQRGYGATWRKLRTMQLADVPLCQDCRAEGRVTIATEVHHVQAKRKGGDNSFENLSSLCKTHHSMRTGRGE